MLKNETIQELETAFNANEISEFIPEAAPHVELINLDLVRIHINDRIHPDDVSAAVVQILKNNDEPGPLKVHVETAKTYKATLYVDIITI